MKKPNITEGEWKYRYNGYYYDIEISGYSFINTIQNETLEYRKGLTKDVELANAKAISAVPEMMDALLDIWLICEPALVNGGVFTKEWEAKLLKAKEVLIKAGCTE